MKEINEIHVLKNFKTFAIAPFYNEVYSSQIHTYSGTFDSRKTIKELMDHYCIHFGADFNGRLKAARKILNIKKNPPVIISEELEINAFQLPLVDYLEPLWVTDLEFDTHPIDQQHSEIEFKNGTKFLVRLSEDKIIKKRHQAIVLLSETKYINSRPDPKYIVLEGGEFYQLDPRKLKNRRKLK